MSKPIPPALQMAIAGEIDEQIRSGATDPEEVRRAVIANMALKYPNALENWGGQELLADMKKEGQPAANETSPND